MLTEQEKADLLNQTRKSASDFPPTKTLWDEYAMAAFTGLLSNPVFTKRFPEFKLRMMAAAAHADVAMEERRKRNV